MPAAHPERTNGSIPVSEVVVRGDFGSHDSRRPIARRLVSLHKDFFGRGPVGISVHLHDDSAFVLLRDGHTRAEETLEHMHRGLDVASQRVLTTAGVEADLTAVVEEETGRRVISFLSSSKQNPSLIVYVFVFSPESTAS